MPPPQTRREFLIPPFCYLVSLVLCSLFFVPPQEEGTSLFMEKRFKEATERYIAAADSASAVPEKTNPGGEEEQAAVALEVRTAVPYRIVCCVLV